VTEPAAEGGQIPDFQVYVRPEWEGGVYSNFVSVWHSPYEFTLDFCATQPPQPVDPEDPETAVVVPCSVVARVKIPVTLIFDVLRALNENMTRYESVFGVISQPGASEEEA
jgi:hypothetical protein